MFFCEENKLFENIYKILKCIQHIPDFSSSEKHLVFYLRDSQEVCRTVSHLDYSWIAAIN